MFKYMAMKVNEYKCSNLELSVGAHIHKDACEYVYLTKLHITFVLSDEVLISYFMNTKAFKMGFFKTIKTWLARWHKVPRCLFPKMRSQKSRGIDYGRSRGAFKLQSQEETEYTEFSRLNPLVQTSESGARGIL